MIGFMDSLMQVVTILYSILLSTHTRVHSHVFTSRRSVAASNGGRSPSSEFPNSPRPQLPAPHSTSLRLNLSSSLTNWVTHQPTNSTLSLTNRLQSTDWLNSLLTVLLIAYRHGSHRKHHSSVVYGPFLCNGRYIVLSQSLPSSGSTVRYCALLFVVYLTTLPLTQIP
jgi:hypothetical protein